MLKKLVFLFLGIMGVLYAVELPNQSIQLSDTPANSFEDAFRRGLIYGHAGALFQQTIEESPTYGDLNLSLGYETRRFSGYKFGAELWLIPKLYEAQTGDFRKGQTYFDLTQLYVDYYHQYEKFGGTIGRYSIDEEWMTHFSEGLSVRYDLVPYVDFSFTWALRNAYITNYYADNFGVFGDYIDAKWSGGAFYLNAIISIPKVPVKIMPYIYFVPNFFVAPGIRGDFDLPITKNILFKAMAHLMSYVELDNTRKAAHSGGGGLIWAEGSFDFSWFRVGVGGIGTPSGGAIYIDGFGQHTPFERTDGIFYYGATTPYAFISMSFWDNFLSAYGAVRATFVNSQTIWNWEAKVDIHIISSVKIGLAAIGMSNPTPAKSRFGGADYMTFRGYVEYRF